MCTHVFHSAEIRNVLLCWSVEKGSHWRFCWNLITDSPSDEHSTFSFLFFSSYKPHYNNNKPGFFFFKTIHYDDTYLGKRAPKSLGQRECILNWKALGNSSPNTVHCITLSWWGEHEGTRFHTCAHFPVKLRAATSHRLTAPFSLTPSSY